MLAIGKKVPSSTVRNEHGEDVSLTDHLGKWIVLYFYPKDDTPGCTKEACSFRNIHAEMEQLGAVVIGVSKDSPEAHRKFVEKYRLNFPLWSDEEHRLIDAFGAWGERSMYGRKYMGTLRSTFIIDPEGKVGHLWEKVTPAMHGEEVLAKLKALMT